MKIMIKRFALRYNGREYKQGTVVNLPDEIAQKLIKESKGDFEEINEVIVENEPEPVKTPEQDGKDVKKEPEKQSKAVEPEDREEDQNDSEETDDRREEPEESDGAELPKTNLAQTVKNSRARK